MQSDENEGTRLESIEDVRRWMEGSQQPAQARPATVSSPQQVSNDTAKIYRPSKRPTMALLCVIDDSMDSGEWVRIRTDEFVIGRSQGDYTIPHDSALSGEHFRIYRRQEKQGSTWRIADLDSRNGTFARVSNGLLKDGQELLLGDSRFQFQMAKEATEVVAEEPQEEQERSATKEWQTLSESQIGKLSPSLVYLTASGQEIRYPLPQKQHLVGTDAQGNTIVLEDAFMSKNHAKVYLNDKGQWAISDCQSLNGTWFRIRDIAVTSFAEIHAGEQRFLIRVA